jgi:hypothetical protein
LKAQKFSQNSPNPIVRKITRPRWISRDPVVGKSLPPLLSILLHFSHPLLHNLLPFLPSYFIFMASVGKPKNFLELSDPRRFVQVHFELEGENPLTK